MSAILASLWPYFAIAGAALVAFLGYGAKQKAAGRKEQAAKQAAADKKAADTAHRIDQEVEALKPADARAELKKWSR